MIEIGDKVICIKELGFMFDEPHKVDETFTVDVNNIGLFKFLLGKHYEIHTKMKKTNKVKK